MTVTSQPGSGRRPSLVLGAAIAAFVLAGCATANAGPGDATCMATPDAKADRVIASAHSGFGYVGSQTVEVDLRGAYVLVSQCTGNGKLGFSIQVDQQAATPVLFDCDGKVQAKPVLGNYSGKHTIVLTALRAMPQETVAVIRPVGC